MTTHNTRRLLLSALCGGGAALFATSAGASNPLEYPDNGSASFSRGGAWLALANEPIAAHYNPAALATQPSGFSVEQQLNFNHVCYERKGPNGTTEGPQTPPTPTDPPTPAPVEYLPVCGERGSFPATIPSISATWRASRTVGIGFAVVPPATYGTPMTKWPALQPAFSKSRFDCLNQVGATPESCGGAEYVFNQPASYRFQELDQLSFIVFPTVGIGWEVFKNFRVGAAFVSGIYVINTTSVGVTTQPDTAYGDNADLDSLSRLKTKDLFVPGAILSLHTSLTRNIDVAAWGRYISPAESEKGSLAVRVKPWGSRGPNGEPNLSYQRPVCVDTQIPTACPQNYAGERVYGENATLAGDRGTFKKFKFPYPPEVRVGVRFHVPRSDSMNKLGAGATDKPSTDPLHDDVFDVELDGSYTMNASANTIEVRFADLNGQGARPAPLDLGKIPPNADRWNGFKDSYGVRLGGQYNVIQDKFAVRAGTWFETQSQEAEWLNIGVTGATRGGFGGGVVFRQDFIDISFGYQRHWSAGLDNKGHGKVRAPQGATQSGEFDISPCEAGETPAPAGPAAAGVYCEPAGVSAADRTQFRTPYTVNNGRITQSAHAFTLGGTVRF